MTHPPLQLTSATDAAPSSSAGRRIIGAVVAGIALVILVVAARLEASPEGLGTHRQIAGMQPCGWIVLMDTPCPTCGMTTAFAHAADGHLLASARAQPLGAVLALATAMALLLGTYVALTGSRIATPLRGLWTRGTLWLLVAFALLAWGWKIMDYKGLL